MDRTSKFAFAQLMPKATTREARAFLEALVAAAAPYEIHTVLTNNGIQFADLLPRNRGTYRQMARPSL